MVSISPITLIQKVTPHILRADFSFQNGLTKCTSVLLFQQISCGTSPAQDSCSTKANLFSLEMVDRSWYASVLVDCKLLD